MGEWSMKEYNDITNVLICEDCLYEIGIEDYEFDYVHRSNISRFICKR
jgi:hypothetical protein